MASKLIVLLIIFGLSASPALAATYYVSPTGNDAAVGTQTTPWKTIQKAVQTVVAGDTIYVRAGTYPTIGGGWTFQNSGTAASPIMLHNYPGEQIVIEVSQSDNYYSAFQCWHTLPSAPSQHTNKADYIQIVGTDVSPVVLPNTVISTKGIVIRGITGTANKAHGVEVAGCDHWEVAGIDFMDMGYGIFTKKTTYSTTSDYSPDHWSIHDNRVYNFYSESGMQFNGSYNLIENNEIYKRTNIINQSNFGCQLLNLLGNNNVVRGNVISRMGSTGECLGILFEWDLSDANVIEQNTIIDGDQGISISGGDNNIIRNNLIYITKAPNPYRGGISISSFNNKTDWPCNETTEAPSIVPANDPAAPDYQYFYNPRNCHSYNNQLYHNVVHGYIEGVRLYPLLSEGTIIRNNIFSGWTHGGICFYDAGTGTCKSPSAEVTASHNAIQDDFGFINLGSYDFHLAANSPLINAGYNLGSLSSNDFGGISRPQGTGYDIGAYEYASASPSPTQKPGDANGDNKVDGVDYVIWLNHYNQSVSGPANGDFDTSGKVDGVDYVIWVNNYGT